MTIIKSLPSVEADNRAEEGRYYFDRLRALAAKLEKEPKYSLAFVLASRTLDPIYSNNFEEIERILIEEVVLWRKNAQLNAHNKKITRLLDRFEGGVTATRGKKGRRP